MSSQSTLSKKLSLRYVQDLVPSDIGKGKYWTWRHYEHTDDRGEIKVEWKGREKAGADSVDVSLQ